MVTKPPVSDFVTARLVRLIAWIFELFADGRSLPMERYRGCHSEIKDKESLPLNPVIFFIKTLLSFHYTSFKYHH